MAANDDTAATGLTPTVTARRVSDGALLAAPPVSEVAGGFYSFSFTAPAVDSYVFLVDGGATLDNAHRYVPLEVPAGGYPDNLDAAVTTRSSAAAVTALGTPAQASALTTVSALVDDLEGRLTAARALLLDNLDATVSSRATTASVAALGAPAQASDLTTLQGLVDDLEARLSAARAALLDNLSRLDVATSTRATPADVNVTVSATSSAQVDIA